MQAPKVIYVVVTKNNVGFEESKKAAARTLAAWRKTDPDARLVEYVPR